MAITILDLFDKLKRLDEISLMEILGITSEELVDRFNQHGMSSCAQNVFQ